MEEKETFMVYSSQSSVAFVNSHTSSDSFMLTLFFSLSKL